MVVMNLEVFLLHVKQTLPDSSTTTFHIKSETVPPQTKRTQNVPYVT